MTAADLEPGQFAAGLVSKATITPAWVSAFEPPPDYLVSEWADASRVLPQSSAARGGRWRTDFASYTRGIMDAVLEPGVRRIYVRKAHQVLVTECLLNICGYFVEHRPAPILYVMPRSDDTELLAKGRIRDMVRRTPALRSVIRLQRGGGGESESTLKLMVFPGGFWALGGANSPNTYAGISALLAIADDFDRFPPVVGDQGKPEDLLTNRTTSFEDEARTIFVSTPVLEDGPIDFGYKHSDQRQYFVPCPHCGRWDYITWNEPDHFRVAFDHEDASTARLECPAPEHGGCGGAIDETERHALLQAGEWRATRTPDQVGDVGFYVWEVHSPFVSLQQLVGKFLAARRGGRENLKVFFQTSIGVGWRDRTGRQNPQGLYAYREDYGEGIEVPEPAVALTSFVDVQKDYFALLVVGWGPGEEKWFIDWRSIPGNTKDKETHAALLAALSRKYQHALGVPIPIHATCIDTGYNTDEVYDFVLANQAKNIYATKGFAGRTGEPIVGKPTERRWGKSPRPVRLYPINVDDAKSEIAECIAATIENRGQGGVRQIHVNARVETFDEEFYAQLMAEHRETRYAKNGVATHQVWVLDRERNEAQDCAAGALAAFRILRPPLAQWAATIRREGELRAHEPASPTNGTPSSSPSPPASRPQPQPRIQRSGYLNQFR